VKNHEQFGMDEQIVFCNGYNATKNSACSKCLKKNLGAISILKGGMYPLAPIYYYTPSSAHMVRGTLQTQHPL
jgi:hypothetical protein